MGLPVLTTTCAAR